VGHCSAVGAELAALRRRLTAEAVERVLVIGPTHDAVQRHEVGQRCTQVRDAHHRILRNLNQKPRVTRARGRCAAWSASTFRDESALLRA
jgi:hypothetical protein